MKWRWLWLGLAIFALLTAGLVVYRQYATVRAFLFGEAYFHGQPTSFWREQLRAANDQGQLPEAIGGQFIGAKDAIPVLLQCTHDKDATVRRAALNLLEHTGERSPEILTAFKEALHDPNKDIRSGTVGALSRWGPEASSALPDLLPLTQGPDEADTGYVKFALWRIDAQAAADAAGWRPIPKDDWGFTATMPPAVEHKCAPTSDGHFVLHCYWSSQFPNRYDLSATELPAVILNKPPEQLLDAVRDMWLSTKKGKLRSEEAVEFQGRQGRQLELEIDEGMGLMAARVFREGSRVYTLEVSCPADALKNETARNYFFDSFRFPEK